MYPYRGLPLPIELLNTLFAAEGQPHDGLASQADLGYWLQANGLASSRPVSLQPIRELRSTLRAVVDALVAGSPPPMTALEALNQLSAAAPTAPRLDWLAGGPRLRTVEVDDPETAVLGRIAQAALRLLAGPERAHLSQCQAPGCVLFFLKERSRRQWCSPACGNRARVARHYLRQKQTVGSQARPGRS